MSRLPRIPCPASPSPRACSVVGVVAFLTCLLWALPHAFADKPSDATPSRAIPSWSDEVVELVSTLPVQADGRVKPFSTWAKFALLKINYMSSMRTPADEKRSAVLWALDTLFFPDVASTYSVFRVPDDAVLTDLGLRFNDGKKKKKKADRYSYEELRPGLPALRRKAAGIRNKLEQEDLKLQNLPRIEQGLMALASNVRDFEGLTRFFDFGRTDLRVGATPSLKQHFGDREFVPLSAFIPKAAELGRGASGDGDGPLAKDRDTIRQLIEAVSVLLGGSHDPRILPPVDSTADAWSSPWQVARDAYAGDPVPGAHVKAIAQLERLTQASGKPQEFLSELRAFHAGVVELAEARDEYGKIELEVHFYKFDPFFKSMLFYVFAFVLVAFGWFRPSTRWWQWVIYGALACGLLLQIYGIVVRCVLRDRPPVSTLYETVIFISAVAVLACLITEWINRRRIAISVAPVLGALGLIMAQGYEELNRQDTMTQLVAVLDTNFWLATHVVIINIGYSAGLLAGALGHLHVLGRAFGLKSKDPGFYTALGRMVYGTLCFCLLFSVVGTILGGIWANDSWGRFWGWDPKENGALMIVIWSLIALHARMGGYIKAHGIAMMAVVLTAVVAFSWWHVNNLGIGLHSYGFTQGILDNLRVFYYIEIAVLLTGTVWWLQNRKGAPAAG